MFYMLVIGLCMIPFINNDGFLRAFNIRMESYWMTIWLVYVLFSHSVSYLMQLGMNLFQRRQETQADNFSVMCGHGDDIYMAMVRNFSENSKILFKSEIVNMFETHPTFLSRLANIDAKAKAKESKQR